LDEENLQKCDEFGEISAIMPVLSFRFGEQILTQTKLFARDLMTCVVESGWIELSQARAVSHDNQATECFLVEIMMRLLSMGVQRKSDRAEFFSSYRFGSQ
jgi:hypothetical protein